MGPTSFLFRAQLRVIRDTVCLNLPWNSNCFVQIRIPKVQVKGAGALLLRALFIVLEMGGNMWEFYFDLEVKTLE